MRRRRIRTSRGTEADLPYRGSCYGESQGKAGYLNGLTRPVASYLERSGLLQRLGADGGFWSADQAILAIDRRRARMAEGLAG